VSRNTNEGRWEESPGGFEEQVKPGLSLVERPDAQLLGEGSKVAPCKEVFQLERRGWHASHDFIAADAREHDAVSLGSHTRCEFFRSFLGAAA
jgi:hypothetical protein